PAMRHGRKNKSTRVDGYKRHLGVALPRKVIVAVALTPANRPEGEAMGARWGDLVRQGFTLQRAHVDRAYLEAPELVAAREAGTEVYCKAFPLRNRGLYTKADFTLDLQGARVVWPAGQVQPLRVGAVTQFPAAVCQR